MTSSSPSSVASNLIPEKKFQSPLRYPGGKQKAIKKIASMLPQKVGEYREPLVGGGSVYLHARSVNIANSYWINDQFSELVAFWKTVQSQEQCEHLKNELTALKEGFNNNPDNIKEYFLKAKQLSPTDRQQMAMLFFFFNRVTFSGTTKAGGFSKSASIKRFTTSSIERLTRMPEALKGTRITEGDFEPVIESSGEDVFIFLDPPYMTAKKLYGRGGSLHDFDHERLAKLLKKTEHRFLITYDDCPQIRELYKWANLQEWSLQYGMNNCNSENKSKIGEELFIFNY